MRSTPEQEREAEMLARKIRYYFSAEWELARLVEYLERRPESILKYLRPVDLDDII